MSSPTCFECGRTASANHHVVPKSLGGTRTIALCRRCHKLVHSPGQALSTGTLNHISRQRRKLVWRCCRCGEEIADRDGYLELDLDDLYRYERDTAAWDEAHRTPAGGINLVDYAEFCRDYPHNPAWRALHSRCDTTPEAETYWFGVERIRTLGQVISWTAHLLEKGWLDKTNWSEILRGMEEPA